MRICYRISMIMTEAGARALLAAGPHGGDAMTVAAGIVLGLAFVLVNVASDSPPLSTVTRLFLLLLALAAGTLAQPAPPERPPRLGLGSDRHRPGTCTPSRVAAA